MIILLTIIHVLVCFFLIIVVLLQSGKAADLAGAFGGMGSQTAFGVRGAATLLSKATTFAAVLFMITSIWLGIQQTRETGVGESVIERTGTGQAAPAPETGAPGSAPGKTGSSPFGSIRTEIERLPPAEQSAPTKKEE